MKGKLDLIISDPPLALIDRYQKEREKRRPIRSGIGTEGMHRPIKKPYLKCTLRKERKTTLFLCARAVMEMINPSPVHTFKKKKGLSTRITALINVLKRHCGGDGGALPSAYTRALTLRSAEECFYSRQFPTSTSSGRTGKCWSPFGSESSPLPDSS